MNNYCYKKSIHKVANGLVYSFDNKKVTPSLFRLLSQPNVLQFF